MITTEITKLQYDIYGLLAERRLKDAFGKLALLVNELQDWVSRDKLNEMETSYRYMIQYMLDGVEDPERKSIYDHLVLSAYVLTDRVSDRLAGQVSPSQYYGWKRYASASRTGISLSSQFDVCDNEINDLSLALLLGEQEQDFSKIQSLKHRIEDTAGNLFMDIWTNYPAAEEDYRSFSRYFRFASSFGCVVELIAPVRRAKVAHSVGRLSPFFARDTDAFALLCPHRHVYLSGEIASFEEFAESPRCIV